MKQIISISIFLVALLALPACTDDLFFGETVTGSYTPQGEPVDAYLDLTVGDLQIDVTTRATADEIEDTEAERRVNDIWLFEYDKSGEYLIDEPQYITITDQSELTNLPVTISNNNGKPVVIYVVANSGSNTWANTGDNFSSLAALKKHTIYNPGPIRIDGVADDTGNTGNTEATMSIPMGGSVGEDTNIDIVIVGGEKITVPVKRMFAKLYVHVAILKSDIDASLSSFYIEHIASTSTVETTYNSDGSWYTPEATRYDVSRYFPASSYPGGTDEKTGTITYGAFVLYVPENIQGEVQTTTDGSVAPPEKAIRLTTGIDATIDGEYKITYSPSYVACPGSWNAKLYNQEYGEDFNIYRNTIYDIQVNITITEDDLVTPSANCIIAPPGVVTAFYPYVRDEEPSAEMKAESNWASELEERYTFTTYLDPYDENGAKTIDHLNIIWQTEDCIGNNTDGNLVWLDSAPADGLTGEARGSAERHRKIYVNPAKEGNALIAAYNKGGDIIWSWHIWATNLPIEADAIEYYHYNWDSNGINNNQFVAGPLVMMCNLGALAEKPTTAGVLNTDTYGMLYQWGRKDPFPPIKTVNKGTNGQATKGGQSFYNYADYDLYISATRDYTIKIGVYDNSNTQINLTGNDGSMNATSGTDVFYTRAAGAVPGSTLGSDDNAVILQSVRHPTMFIAASNLTFSSNGSETGQANNIGSYYNSGDWLPVGDDFLWGGGHPGTGEFQVYSQDNNVYDEYNQRYRIDAYLENDYGPNKQIFDPCPYGWRVSSGEIWLGFTYDGKNWGNNTDAYTNQKWDKVNCADPIASDGTYVTTVNTQCGYTFYMQGWRTGVTSFFPLQAARSPSGQPYLLAGICGNYHNATVDKEYHLNSWSEGVTIRRVDILHLHAESSVYGLVKPFTNELYYYTKAVAGPLRCVRDTK